MSRLTRYLCRLFLIRLAVILFAVTGFALLFDLMDVGNRVLRRAEPGSWPLLRYAMIRTPTLVTELLPLVTVVAGLFTVTELIRHRELVAMWNAGLSRAGVLLRLWPMVLLIVGGKLLIDDLAVPATIPELRSLRVADFKTVGLPEAPRIWVQSGDDVVRLPKDAAVTGQLHEIIVIRMTPEGQLVERIDAARATPAAGAWELHDVIRRPASSRTPITAPAMTWPTAIDLDKVGLMAKVPRELTLAQLADVVANDGYGVGDPLSQRTWLNARVAGAIGLGTLMLLPFALARRFERMGALARLWVQGLTLGFVWLIGNGLMLAVGEIDLVTPEVAAWSLPILFILLIARLAGIPEWPRGPGRVKAALK